LGQETAILTEVSIGFTQLLQKNAGKKVPQVGPRLLPYISLPSTDSIIALMMEAVRTSEMLVNFNMITRRYIP
jgi:hypothetical protein